MSAAVEGSIRLSGPRLRVAAASLLALVGCAVARAADDDPLEAVRVLSLSEADQTAVVRVGDGELELVAAGDTLPGTSARLVEVLPDRLVLEDGEEAAGLTRLWLFRERESGSRLQRLDREPPPLPPVSGPRPPEPAPEEPSDDEPEP